jgi:hypothetical protein
MFSAGQRNLWHRWRLHRIAPFGLLLALLSSAGHCQQDSSDRERYYRGVDYCRRNVWPSSMLLSPDKQVLCFNGMITRDMDVSAAKGLGENALFVVRSPGGYSGLAVVLAEIVRDRHATVVVYDYCLSACALIFLIASEQTYVLRGTLVAWHLPRSTPEEPLCSSLTVARDGGPRKLQRGPCGDGGFAAPAAYSVDAAALRQFFKDRVFEPQFEAPPDSVHVRKIVSSLFAETGVYRDVGWTLHPRFYPRMLKTKIVYEAYPESQEEVDDMLARLHLNWRVIYDP